MSRLATSQTTPAPTAKARVASTPQPLHMCSPMQSVDSLVLHKAPPLDPAWLQHEQDVGLRKPQRKFTSPLERQPIYAEQCRQLNASMMAPGARDHHLSQGVTVRRFTVPSSLDGFAIPVVQYDLDAAAPPSVLRAEHQQSPLPQLQAGTLPQTQPELQPKPASNHVSSAEGASAERAAAERASAERASAERTIIVYIHGGGLLVGEADSEELSCRRILKECGLPHPTVYSIGYRLLPAHPATTCVADCVDAFDSICASVTTANAVSANGPAATSTATGSSATTSAFADRPAQPRILLVGSSSGGQLAALLSQLDASRPTGPRVTGVVLRCPVTSDAFSGAAYVPSRLRHLHASAWDPSFVTVLGGVMTRRVPRDGLARMPLEADEAVLARLSKTRHWVQLTTNDTLYSDGLAYVAALRAVGVQVEVDVVFGWPHTFWLPYPHLRRALEADEAMLEGLRWVAGR